MAKITLENMEFYAYHGCMEHEKQLGNTFFVTTALTLDTETAGKTDKLEDTLNYQHVYDIVKMEMNIPSKLIEHIARRIVDSLLNKLPQIEAVYIKLTKLNPPLGAKVASVCIEIEKKRSKE